MLKITKKLLLVPTLIILLAAGCNAKTVPANSNTVSESPVELNSVKIKDYKFGPATLTIKKGTTVTWENQDTAHHNVVAQGDNAATGPKSKLLAQGEKYSYTFNTVGNYDYLCEPHPYMTGSIVVTE